MKPEALAQAQRRLQKAEAANLQLKNAKSIEDTRVAWSDFLLAAAGIYTKLQRGVARTGPEQEWFQEVLRERETDELLKYILEARNSDEHGITEVTGDKGRSAMHKMPDGTFAGYKIDDPEDFEIVNFRAAIINADGTKTPYVIQPVVRNYAALKNIIDERNSKKGNVYRVPQRHLDKDLLVNEPREVANLVLPYLRDLVRIAGAFS